MVDERPVDNRPHVVIVGAGFAGLSCAKALSATAKVRVTVVDQNNYHTFLPLLYQVATSGLASSDIAYPVRGVLRGCPAVDLRVGRLEAIDAAQGEIMVGSTRIRFDHLVIATGSRPAFFGVNGAEEHAFTMYSLDEALRLRNHLLRCFEAADAEPKLVDDGALNVVVVGGGPTGVEIAGAIRELDDNVLQRDYPNLAVPRARVVLVEQSDSLLGSFTDRSRRHALETLVARGVDVRVGTMVDEVTPNRVRLDDGTVIRAHSVVWAAGVQASKVTSMLEECGGTLGRGGRVVVDPDLSVRGVERVWAVGDVAEMPDVAHAGGRPLPQLAQPALQSGRHAARQIIATLAGDPTRPLRYHDKGTMATIGRRAAVAELPGGIKLRGLLAWIAWLTLHLVMLMGMRNRAAVFVNWAWNYLTWDRGPRLIIESKRT